MTVVAGPPGVSEPLLGDALIQLAVLASDQLRVGVAPALVSIRFVVPKLNGPPGKPHALKPFVGVMLKSCAVALRQMRPKKRVVRRADIVFM